jgi:hypothetical protein
MNDEEDDDISSEGSEYKANKKKGKNIPTKKGSDKPKVEVKVNGNKRNDKAVAKKVEVEIKNEKKNGITNAAPICS